MENPGPTEETPQSDPMASPLPETTTPVTPPADPDSGAAEGAGGPVLKEPIPVQAAAEEAEDAALSESPAFEALLEKTEVESKETVSVGELVSGTIQSFSDATAFVDYGGRSEGMIDVLELKDDDGELTHKVGDSIKAYVIEMEGEVKLSQVLKVTNRQTLKRAFEHEMPIEGRVTGFNTGGLVVNLGGLRAFCPFSQIDTAFTEDPADFAGKTLTFRIIEFKGGGRNIVLSRRVHMEGQVAEQAQEIRTGLEVGATLEGTVTRVEPYGAFVDIGGGVEGLVHVSEMGHARVEDPNTVVAAKDSLKVKVLELKDLGSRKERISLSMKALLPDPWEDVSNRFREGDVITGKVVSVQNFGAFVELAPGIEGLVHISQLSQKRVSRPGEVVTQGQEVQARILQIEERRKRISLSMKSLVEQEHRQAASEDMAAYRAGQVQAKPDDGPLAEALRRAGFA